LHKYLYRKELHPHSNHSVLTWLLKFKSLNGQTAFWVQCLLQCNYTSQHNKGNKHTRVYALYRRDQLQKNAPTARQLNGRQSLKVRVGTAEGEDHTALSREQLPREVEQLLCKVEARQRLEGKDISYRNTNYKSYSAQ
jgi:hypothetical protein